MVIEGYTGQGENKELFMRMTLKMVLVSEVNVEANDGDLPICAVVIDYGAIQIDAFEQDQTGQVNPVADAKWSRVNSTNDLTVE